MHYLLCGFSGAGKTYLLNEIKKKGKYPGYTFIDLDEHFEEETQLKILDYVEKNGIDSFREKEFELLRQLVGRHKDLWLSLGGGSLSEKAIIFLGQQSVKLFWVKRDFEFCWQNIKNDKNRFLVKSGKDEMQKIFKERLKLFQKYPVFTATDHF